MPSSSGTNRFGTMWEQEERMRETCTCLSCRQFRETGARNVERVYNEDGFDQFGFDRTGYNAEGRDRYGYDAEGRDAEGFDRTGYNAEGRDRYGYDAEGYNTEGYNTEGYGRDGYNRDGYNYRGYNAEGYNSRGFDRTGYNREGYDVSGFNRLGYDSQGFDASGYNRRGLDRRGRERPCMCDACQVNRGDRPRPDISWFRASDYRSGRRRQRNGREYGFYDQAPSDVLRNYSYRPTLVFRHVHGEDASTAPYLGIEVEMTSHLSTLEMALVRRDGQDGRLLYLKSDGSVQGFEMVSHPMTMSWAAQNFNFRLIDDLVAAGSSVDPTTNGLHVHVARNGFKDEAHQLRWGKLWYRNTADIVRIAGRDSQRWGGFNLGHRQVIGAHCKQMAKIRHGDLNAYLTSEYVGARYNALNLSNEATIEVRIFAAPTSGSELRSRMELVAATVEYTRNLTVRDINAGGWTWEAFRAWLTERESIYPALAAVERQATALVLR